MAGLNSLAVGGGVTDPVAGRHATGGLLAVQGPTDLDIRTGILAGPGCTALVTGTADTGQMTVQIGAHHSVTSRGTANGPYLGPNLTAATKVNIAAAPGSGSRIDVVYEKQQDGNSGVPSPDTTTAPLYGVLQGVVSTGTPAKPDITTIPGALELGTVTVAAGATSTNGSGVTIANTARLTAPRNAIVPVANAADRLSMTGYPGLQVMELDTTRRYVHTGASWVYAGGGTPPVTAITPAVGWTAASGLGVFLDASGLKHLTGWFSNTTAFTPAGGEVLGNLPVGFRPLNPLFPQLPVSVGQTAIQVNITTAGVISVARPASAIGAGALWDTNHVTFL